MGDFKLKSVGASYCSLENIRNCFTYLAKCNPVPEEVHTDIATAHSAKCSCLKEKHNKTLQLNIPKVQLIKGRSAN
jgi:hypothetical protein